jgi:hypothetical protein
MEYITIRYAYKTTDGIAMTCLSVRDLEIGIFDRLNVREENIISRDLSIRSSDKDGVSIFENDILEWQDPAPDYPEHKERWQVMYDYERGKWVFGISKIGIDNPRIRGNITVIGNIHINPELLNKKK